MRKLLLPVLSILFVGQALACSCYEGYEPDFYKNVTKDHKVGVFVFQSHGIYNWPDGFQSVFGNVILLESFNSIGSALGDTLSMVLADGVNCGEWPGAFKPGDTLVLALQDYGYWPVYGQDTFFLSGLCGLHYLKLTNEQHEGLTTTEIKEKILGLLLSVDDWTSSIGLEVFPNPAYETVTIKAPSHNILSVDLFDMQGRWLYRKENATEVMELDLSGIIPGLYLLSVVTDLGVDVQKLVKY